MKLQRLYFCVVLLAAFLAPADDAPESPVRDKSQYNLLNPTPAEQMREWWTDQAGVSPYTVDAGHFEAELSAFRYSYKQRSSDTTFRLVSSSSGQTLSTTQVTGTRTVQRWDFGSMTLKAGLLNNLDAEISLVPYTTTTATLNRNAGQFTSPVLVTIPASEQRSTSSGFGDTVARLKLNVWGNDEGKTALSLSGQVKFPTASDDLGNGQFEGGPSVEFAAQIPYGFKLRIDSYVNFFESRGSGEAGFENLISLAHQLVGNLEAYCAFDTWTYTVSRENWSAALVAGANYRLCQNAELFAGSGFGLNGNVYDFSPFLGFNVRY